MSRTANHVVLREFSPGRMNPAFPLTVENTSLTFTELKERLYDPGVPDFRMKHNPEERTIGIPHRLYADL